MSALLGDQTGNLYNKINGIDQQIAATTRAVEERIVQKAVEIKADIDGMLNNLQFDGKKILDTILNFANSPADQIGTAALEVILGLIPGVGQAIDFKDTVVALNNIFIQGKRDVGEFIGLIGALAGWVPGVGDAIKSVAKLAVNAGGALVSLLAKIGPEATDAVIKGIKQIDWGKILKDVVAGFAKKWNDFRRVMDDAAGWIINSLPGLKPAFAGVDNTMLAFTNKADDVAAELTPTQKNFLEVMEDSKKKAVKETGEIIRKHNSVEAARNAALKEAGDLGDSKVAVKGRLPASKGFERLVGFESKDGKRGFRVDYDPNKGLHYNWYDYSQGKRSSGLAREEAEIIEGGTEEDFIRLLDKISEGRNFDQINIKP